MNQIISGKRRFTCLTPRLVRIEYSPDGVFEDRPSMVAINRLSPLLFESEQEQSGKLTLKVGDITILSSQNESEFFPVNLRIDFKIQGCTHTWRFGDRDYQNLGGAVRSLDYYSRENLLTGVHPAATASPNEYFHVDAELFDTAKVYMEDGHLDWQFEIMRQGLPGALENSPHMVYNRYRNMAGDLARFQPGLLSRSGYFLLEDSHTPLVDSNGHLAERANPGYRDLYFFAYGQDYKAALRDYITLTGRAPIPPKNIFGILFSRWPAFGAEEAQEIVKHFSVEGIPLSGLMLDLEWHVPDFCHWDWNPVLFPQPEEFFDWAHQQNLLVALNVHPQYIFSSDSHFSPFVETSASQHKVQTIWENPIAAMTVKSGAEKMVETNLANPQEAQAIQNLCCAPLLKQGVDFWWLDGASAELNGVDGQLLSTRIFHQTMHPHQQRPLVMARYGGLGSHRYGILFTGDTQSQWEVMESECEFTIRAGQVGMAYVSHDIGGFTHSEAPIIDSDLYIRWLQFGVFSPIFRFHSAPGAGSRQPWDYGQKNLEIATHWLKFRHALLPYIYTAAQQAYEEGLPLVRGMYLENPQDIDAYIYDQYMFGDALLVAPILTPRNHRSLWLPDGDWYEFESGQLLTGGGQLKTFAELGQVPLYVKAGAIIPMQMEGSPNRQGLVKNLVLHIFPDQAGTGSLYEDDGCTCDYQSNHCSLTQFYFKREGNDLIINGGKPQGKSMGASRNIRLSIIAEQSPTSITCNNITVKDEDISYDSFGRRINIHLGDIPINQPWQVIVKGTEN